MLASLLLFPIASLHDERGSTEQPVSEVIRLLSRPRLMIAMWLMALPAVVSGAFNVLGPLQLHHLGAGAAVIGVTFLVGAGMESVVSPLAGGFSDRHGRALPLLIGLLGVAAGFACFTLPSVVVLLVLLMIATSTMLGVFWAPVMALVSDIAEAYGIDQAHAAALMNLAWALGQIAGSAGGGATGKAWGDGVPTLGAAALCLLTLPVVWQRRAGSRTAKPLRQPDPAE